MGEDKDPPSDESSFVRFNPDTAIRIASFRPERRFASMFGDENQYLRRGRNDALFISAFGRRPPSDFRRDEAGFWEWYKTHLASAAQSYRDCQK